MSAGVFTDPLHSVKLLSVILLMAARENSPLTLLLGFDTQLFSCFCSNSSPSNVMSWRSISVNFSTSIEAGVCWEEKVTHGCTLSNNLSDTLHHQLDQSRRRPVGPVSYQEHND